MLEMSPGKHLEKVLAGVCATLLSGCASLYMAEMRGDYNDDGKTVGLYGIADRYPSVYCATKIAVLVEIPTWWWPGDMELVRKYQVWLWPFGAVLSIADVPMSLVSDTVMLPYDLYKVGHFEGIRTSERKDEQPWR